MPKRPMAHHKTVWRNNEKDRVRSCIRFIVGRFGVCSGKNVPGDVRRWSLSCFMISLYLKMFSGAKLMESGQRQVNQIAKRVENRGKAYFSREIRTCHARFPMSGLSWNWLGVWPYSSLKHLAKYFGSLKPTA